MGPVISPPSKTQATLDSKALDLSGLTLPEVIQFVEELGERPYRAGQVYRWIHQRAVSDFDQMTDLSKAFRQTLKERATLSPLEKDLEQRSADGTIKYRFRTADGKLIEAVYMPSEDRRTLCVSTQAGCAMGCTFCMTATLGLQRNLTPGEMVSQVNWVNGELKLTRAAPARPLTNLVFMGMGEPLHNFDSLKKALSILQSEEGANFSHRHITVSTVGLVPMIERFGRETDVKLAISLNASFDEQRSKLMPINRRWNIAPLLDACRKFPLRQGRRITFEYVLMAGVNDSDEDAHRLVELLRGIPAKVNLIPYNENPGLEFHSTPEQRAEAFRAILAEGHLAAFVRKNRGRDIAAACGQLANLSPGGNVSDRAPSS
ncbi:MAG TPA: 23S rRNA (adenine(2503)-C(2))-methyltransferase RlmN [Myxococcaceae bacterium]|nr:23S rRNA (adenine(2503)-C(2))-methyltransferase RlmN [Myxococcaceae bacterium]